MAAPVKVRGWHPQLRKGAWVLQPGWHQDMEDNTGSAGGMADNVEPDANLAPGYYQLRVRAVRPPEGFRAGLRGRGSLPS